MASESQISRQVFIFPSAQIKVLVGLFVICHKTKSPAVVPKADWGSKLPTLDFMAAQSITYKIGIRCLEPEILYRGGKGLLEGRHGLLVSLPSSTLVDVDHSQEINH